jgi:hypothetical protein
MQMPPPPHPPPPNGLVRDVRASFFTKPKSPPPKRDMLMGDRERRVGVGGWTLDTNTPPAPPRGYNAREAEYTTRRKRRGPSNRSNSVAFMSVVPFRRTSRVTHFITRMGIAGVVRDGDFTPRRKMIRYRRMYVHPQGDRGMPSLAVSCRPTLPYCTLLGGGGGQCGISGRDQAHLLYCTTKHGAGFSLSPLLRVWTFDIVPANFL